MIENHKDAFGGMKVETAAASLETTEAASESRRRENIVLETTLSAEEIRSKEFEKTVQSIVDSYANLGIAEVSGYLNVRKTRRASERLLESFRKAVPARSWILRQKDGIRSHPAV